MEPWPTVRNWQSSLVHVAAAHHSVVSCSLRVWRHRIIHKGSQVRHPAPHNASRLPRDFVLGSGLRAACRGKICFALDTDR